MTDNLDRAQVRDLGAVSHNRPIMADLGAIPGVIGVSPTDADVRRLQDEVAFLTRSRDEWRDLQQRAATSAKVATMACQRMREDRESVREHLTRDRDFWRERAQQAEARLAQRVGCGGAA